MTRDTFEMAMKWAVEYDKRKAQEGRLRQAFGGHAAIDLVLGDGFGAMRAGVVELHGSLVGDWILRGWAILELRPFDETGVPRGRLHLTEDGRQAVGLVEADE